MEVPNLEGTSCEICGCNSMGEIAECVVCNQCFCFSGLRDGKNHMQMHIDVYKHAVWSVPGVGEISCCVCGCNNIMQLYFDGKGIVYCTQHRAQECEQLAGASCFALESLARNMLNEGEAYEASAIPVKTAVAKTNAVIEIPAKFPALGKNMLTTEGRTLIEEEFMEEIIAGELEFKNSQWIAGSQELEQQVTALCNKQFQYEEILGAAYEAEFAFCQANSTFELNNGELWLSSQREDAFLGFFTSELTTALPFTVFQSVMVESSNESFFGYIMSATTQLAILIAGVIPMTWITRLPSEFLLKATTARTPHEVRLALEKVRKAARIEPMIKALLEGNSLSDEANTATKADNGDTRFELSIILRSLKPSSMPLGGNHDFDDSQYEAVSFALKHGVSVIQGCAGSGKTYTAVLISYILEKRHPDGKILYCVYSDVVAKHFAAFALKLGLKVVCVENRMEEIKSNNVCFSDATLLLVHEIVCAKIARQQYSDEHLSWDVYQHLIKLWNDCSQAGQEQNARGCNPYFTFYCKLAADQQLLTAYEHLEELELKDADIVVCFSESAADERIGRFKYSAVLIDDATLFSECESAFVLASAKQKIILLGDEQQEVMRMRSLQQRSSELNRSLMSRAIENKAPTINLSKQYRSHGGLFDISNSLFYGRTNQSLIDSHEFTAENVAPAGAYPRLLSAEFTSFMWDVDNVSDAAQSSAIILQLVDYFVNGCKIDRNCLGVIALDIALLEPYLAKFEGVEVGTPVEFAGRSKSVIIVLCNPSSDDLVSGNSLALALTRASDAFVAVGSGVQLYRRGAVWSAFVEYFADRNVLYSGASFRQLHGRCGVNKKTSSK